MIDASVNHDSAKAQHLSTRIIVNNIQVQSITLDKQLQYYFTYVDMRWIDGEIPTAKHIANKPYS
jgi:hypothetical protein